MSSKLKTRIILVSTNHKVLDEFTKQIKEIAEKTGSKYTGPVYLPTKRVVIPTRRSPCGEGTHTWDKFEMRIHKRLIEIEQNERTMRHLIRLVVPEDVFIEVRLK
ncbi:MAG: 30S ribosomal protein S10 [Candidatus Geothermarchaeota archaeon]